MNSALLAATTKRPRASQYGHQTRCYPAFVLLCLRRKLHMRSDGLRQSDRINFRMPVEASWFGSNGTTFKRTATTMLVSKNGGVLRLAERPANEPETTPC